MSSMMMLVTAAVLMTGSIAQITAPAVLLSPSSAPVTPTTQPTTSTATITPSLSPQLLDPFHVGIPVIAPPFAASTCNPQLSPCQINNTWICISDLTTCHSTTICPKELQHQCRISSGETLCYNSELMICSDGKLLHNNIITSNNEFINTGFTNNLINPLSVTNPPAVAL